MKSKTNNQINSNQIEREINSYTENLQSNNTNIKYNNTTTHYVGKHSIGDLLVLTGDTEDIQVEDFGNFPSFFFESEQCIFIPNKVERWLEWYAPKQQLRDINKDFKTAIELCLMFLSNLSNSYYLDENANWKRLNLEILSEQLCINESDKTHKKIIDFLRKNKIIERSATYIPTKQSYSYKLSDTYLNKGVKKYTLTTNRAINLYRKNYFKRLNDAINNPIANNMIKMYKTIELPSQEEIIAEAKKLIKNKYKTKKGKILTFLNKNSRERYKDADSRSFVEDSIDLYNRLTDGGKKFLIPKIGSSKNGGRVSDSFTLMPAWIRNLIRIDGVKAEEADFQSLHPNIAMTIYGGNSEYITHQKVADEIGDELQTIKIEHIAFFNKTWAQMANSPLFNYYCAKEPAMMEKIYTDKDMFGHEITSRKFFKLEVIIMTDAVRKLNSEGIYVGYVYDALFFHPKHKQRVVEVMNESAEKFKVKTKVK